MGICGGGIFCNISSDSLYFSKEIGSKACQLNMSLELENKGKVMIHGDLGEWESDQSKKMQNGS